MKRTAAKIFVVRWWNFAKNKNFWRADCSGPEWRHRQNKLLADCFKTLADGPKTGLLAARAISNFKVTWAGEVPQYCRNCKRFTRAQGNTTVKLLIARVLMWPHVGFMSDFDWCAMNHVRLLSKNNLHNLGRTTTVLCIHVWKTHLWSMLNYFFCVYPSPAKHKFCIFRSSVYAFIKF